MLLEDIASDGRIILKLIITNIGCECLDRINVAKDINQWRYRANTKSSTESGEISSGWLITNMTLFRAVEFLCVTFNIELVKRSFYSFNLNLIIVRCRQIKWI
jgi:hypothetical protein